VKVKVKVGGAKSTLARQLLLSLHDHFLFQKPQSQHTHNTYMLTSLSRLSRYRSYSSMDIQYDDADAFEDGIAHTLSMLTDTLTDTIDDESATTIIRFALLAVGVDAKKLRTLIIMIYNSTTPSNECIAKLLVKLLDLTPSSIKGRITESSGEVVVSASLNLSRYIILREFQYDFENTIAQVVWSPKPIIVAATVFGADHVVKELIEERILDRMADSDHLFVPQNFELFVNTCLSYGPKLDASTCKFSRLTAVFHKVSARVPAESKMFKLAMAGLVAARNNDWIVETNTTPQVLTSETEPTTPGMLTPETESTYELENVNQEDLIAPE
jgi:hypothetical protein